MRPQTATVRPRQSWQIVGARDLVPRVEELAHDVFAALARARRRTALRFRRQRAESDALGHLDILGRCYLLSMAAFCGCRWAARSC